jgi:ABC-type amino acid transport substrate-binding protein
MANFGEVDGLPRKVGDFNLSYPNLIRVDVPIIIANLTAYSSNPETVLDGWESLRETNRKVAYLSGIQHSKDILSSLIPSNRLFAVNDRESALKMLLHDRIDLYVDVDIPIDMLIENNKELSRKIYKAGIMERKDNYIFLHKKHEGLVTEVETVLKEMIKEGLFD